MSRRTMSRSPPQPLLLWRPFNPLLAVLALAVFFSIGIAAQDPPTDQPGAPTAAPVNGATEAPTDSWTGCVDPVLGYRPVTIGQPTTICLVLGNNVDWATEMTYMRLHFQATADEYSRFHVPQSYAQLIQAPEIGASTALTQTFPGNITVHSESQTALSYQKRYFDGSDRIYPYLTAIVDVSDGVVTGISWDNACIFCSSNECEPNTYDFAGNLATESDAQQPVGGCYITKEDCNKALEEGKADCDLLLYVVWTGTDSQGRDFQSSAYRFSAFPAQSWTDRVSQSLPAFVPQSTEDLQNLNPINRDLDL